MTLEGLIGMMKRAGISRKDLAEALDVDVVTVWRWEKGLREPKQKYIANMTIILHCTSDELLGINPTPSAGAEKTTQDSD